MRLFSVEVCYAASYAGVLLKCFFPVDALGGAGTVALLQAVHAEGLVEVHVGWVGSSVGAVGSEAVSGFGMADVSTFQAPEGVGTLLTPMGVVEAARRAERGDSRGGVIYSKEGQSLGCVAREDEAVAEGSLLVCCCAEGEVVPVPRSNCLHVRYGSVEVNCEGCQERIHCVL